jgi:outer membrane protein assembly factor BamE
MKNSLASIRTAGILAVLHLTLLTGCGGLIYKQDIQQGNVLDADDVAELSEGMTKRQVQVLLGSPSVQSPFHADRWDYMNSYARRGGRPEKRVLTLHFENNRLVAMEGNYLDEDDVARRALEELQEPEDTPIQDLDTLQQPEFDPDLGT